MWGIILLIQIAVITGLMIISVWRKPKEEVSKKRPVPVVVTNSFVIENADYRISIEHLNVPRNSFNVEIWNEGILKLRKQVSTRDITEAFDIKEYKESLLTLLILQPPFNKQANHDDNQ